MEEAVRIRPEEAALPRSRRLDDRRTNTRHSEVGEAEDRITIGAAEDEAEAGSNSSSTIEVAVAADTRHAVRRPRHRMASCLQLMPLRSKQR